MQEEEHRERLRPRKQLRGQEKLNQDIKAPRPTCLLVENTLLSTAQVAAHLCGIPFRATETANEILLNIIARRDPGKITKNRRL